MAENHENQKTGDEAPVTEQKDSVVDRRGLLRAAIGTGAAVGAYAIGTNKAHAAPIDACGNSVNLPPLRNMSLAEFQKDPAGLPQVILDNLGLFKGGRFMDCHEKIRAATGIWVDELVPVLQKYDAILASTPCL